MVSSRDRLGLSLQHERARLHLDGRGESTASSFGANVNAVDARYRIHRAARRRLHRQRRADPLPDGPWGRYQGRGEGQELGGRYGQRSYRAFGIPHPETVALLEQLGSANSHNCRSDQCLVAPKEDLKKPTTATPPPTAATVPPAAAASAASGKKPGGSR